MSLYGFSRLLFVLYTKSVCASGSTASVQPMRVALRRAPRDEIFDSLEPVPIILSYGYCGSLEHAQLGETQSHTTFYHSQSVSRNAIKFDLLHK